MCGGEKPERRTRDDRPRSPRAELVARVKLLLPPVLLTSPAFSVYQLHRQPAPFARCTTSTCSHGHRQARTYLGEPKPEGRFSGSLSECSITAIASSFSHDGSTRFCDCARAHLDQLCTRHKGPRRYSRCRMLNRALNRRAGLPLQIWGLARCTLRAASQQRERWS